MPGAVHLYLLAGDDDHLLRRALEDLLGELRAAEPDLDVDQIEGGEAAHLPDLRTGSLFGGGRCLVLRGAERITADLLRDAEAYLTDPVPGAIIVAVSRSTDRRGRLSQLAEQHGERREVRRPRVFDLAAWEALARDELRRHGRQVDHAAVRALLDHAGNDPATLASRCAQVAATTPAGLITAADVEQTVVGHGNRGGFAIADAVAARDVPAALVALRGALEGGEDPLRLLGALAYRIRQLLQVRAGASATQLGVSPGMVRFLQRETRRFAPGELAWCHDRLARADLDLKASDLPPQVLIELVVVDLATPRRVGPPWNRAVQQAS